MAERRADRTAETRSRIERAALKKFVEQGIAETSIRDIANEAQLSLGAMYNHFVSKDDLAWQIFIQGWTEIGSELKRRSQDEPTLLAKFRSMIEYVFRRFDEDWLHVSYIFSSRHQHLNRAVSHDNRRAAVKSGYDRYIAEVGVDPYLIFRQIIADAMRRGEIPPGDLELKTALVVGGIVQAIDSRILVRLKGKLADSAAAAAALYVRMLGAEV